MFDFQKPDVYQKAKEFNKGITKILVSKAFDRVTNDQLRRVIYIFSRSHTHTHSPFSISGMRLSKSELQEIAMVGENAVPSKDLIMTFVSEIQNPQIVR